MQSTYACATRLTSKYNAYAPVGGWVGGWAVAMVKGQTKDLHSTATDDGGDREEEKEEHARRIRRPESLRARRRLWRLCGETRNDVSVRINNFAATLFRVFVKQPRPSVEF